MSEIQTVISPIAVANFFIEKSINESDGTCTPLKILKLTYISHGWYMALFDKPLLDEKIQAWKYGPVIPTLYYSLKGFENNVISTPVTYAVGSRSDFKVIQPKIIDNPTIEFLDSIWENYKKYNGIELSILTHQKNSPWDITWNKMGAKNQKHVIIDNDLIKTHYKELLSSNSK